MSSGSINYPFNFHQIGPKFNANIRQSWQYNQFGINIISVKYKNEIRILWPYFSLKQCSLSRLRIQWVRTEQCEHSYHGIVLHSTSFDVMPRPSLPALPIQGVISYNVLTCHYVHRAAPSRARCAPYSSGIPIPSQKKHPKGGYDLRWATQYLRQFILEIFEQSYFSCP